MLDAKAVADPASQTKRLESSARYLRVDRDDLPKLMEICKSIVENLKAIGADARRYSQSERNANRKPDPAVTHEFSERREAAIRGGIDQLKMKLSAASWKGVHGYINGSHRASIHRQPLNSSAHKREMKRTIDSGPETLMSVDR